MLATTVTLSLLLAYGRQFGAAAVGQGVVAAGGAVGWGALLALGSRRRGVVVYWAVLGSLFAFLSVVGVFLFAPSARWTWTLVGATAGGLAARWADHPWLSMALAGAAGSAIMAVYGIALFGGVLAWGFDLAAAGIASAMLAGIVCVMEWIDSRRELTRSLLATWLIAAVLVGNLLALRFVPGW